ncbi:hypothetical protein [Lentzea sp. NBRC 105346]|uniref:hypothetical protein n=1 Tax=Lentzea sp. NBRC 105346 TaxID=3032205 RepID=UPI002552788E|nr:hypothetical protein [Lentzea sp. NBRC 105346]
MSRIRAVLAIAAALVTLAGCASGPGLDKHVSNRRTVPANAANTANTVDPTSGQSSGKPVDPAFAVEKLRLVDPCKLMSKDLLEPFGKPDTRYSGSAYTRCSNYMKDTSGKDLNFSVEVGYQMSYELSKATKQLAGLKSYEQKLDSGACFISAITQENPPIGVRMQVGYKTGDACEAGRKLLESVIKKLKSNPPKYTVKKGSPIELDPCTVPDQAAIKEGSGEGARMLLYGLHSCGWNTRTVNLTLDFRLTYVPKDNKFDDKQTEVDLGNGVKGYQTLQETAYPTCNLLVLLTKDGNGNGEVVAISVAGSKEDQFDRCAKAQAFAKALLPKLPKA